MSSRRLGRGEKRKGRPRGGRPEGSVSVSVDHLEALQHGKLGREPLQPVGGQADVGDQQQLVQVAQSGQVLKGRRHPDEGFQ